MDTFDPTVDGGAIARLLGRGVCKQDERDAIGRLIADVEYWRNKCRYTVVREIKREGGG